MIINKYVILALIFLALELALINNKDELIDWISELGLFLFVYLIYMYFKKFWFYRGRRMKDKIIPMLIILGFSTFFVDDEKSFYSWFSWAGLFVGISLLSYYILGGF